MAVELRMGHVSFDTVIREIPPELMSTRDCHSQLMRGHNGQCGPPLITFFL